MLREGSALSRSRPSISSTCAAVAPASGEPACRCAMASNRPVTASAAPRTAEPTLDVVHEPPCAGAFGWRVSPSSNCTCSSRVPRNSAAIIVMTV